MFNKKPLLMTLAATLISATSAMAAAPIQKSVEALFAEKAQLNGKQVQIKGKVAKVTNGVMKKNFLHLKDGTGKQGTDDLTVTSQDTAQIGDEVIVTGVVATDLDFGAGYTFPLILQDATIKKVK